MADQTPSFISVVIAKLKGDDKEVLAGKIARKASSAINQQIAALNAKQVDCEQRVEDAQEALQSALYPVTMITDSKGYADKIVAAQAALDARKQDLEDCKNSLKYFSGILSSF